MITRFELAIVVRVQVSDRALLRHSLAVEAVMEELAVPLGLDRELAAKTGLGAGVDRQLCRANPERRGAVAAEILATEGAEPELVEAVELATSTPVDQLNALARALVVSEALVATIYGELVDDDDDDSIDELTGAGVATRLELAARKPTGATARRAVAAAAATGMPLASAADHALAAMRRVRVDLGL